MKILISLLSWFYFFSSKNWLSDATDKDIFESSPNKSKCEITSIGSFQGIETSLRYKKYIALTKESVKIIKTSFFYNKAVQNELNYRTYIYKIQGILKLWRMIRLSIEGKIILFKFLAISKIVFRSLLTSVTNYTTEELIKIHEDFVKNFTAPKIKLSATRVDYRNDG